MHGRVYDYQSGRFLSRDPFISMPGSSQAYNPYSYVMNNPLSYTDPSGYIAESNFSMNSAGAGSGSIDCSKSVVCQKRLKQSAPKKCNNAAWCAKVSYADGHTQYVVSGNGSGTNVSGTPKTPVGNTGPFELSLDFITGEGATNRYFGPDSDISKQFSEGDGAKTFEEFLSSKYDGNPQPGDGVTNFGYKFTWFFRAWTTNSAEHFMGSWKGTAKVMDDMILFRAANTAGTHSLFFGRQIDEANKFLGVTNAPTLIKFLVFQI